MEPDTHQDDFPKSTVRSQFTFDIYSEAIQQLRRRGDLLVAQLSVTTNFCNKI